MRTLLICIVGLLFLCFFLNTYLHMEVQPGPAAPIHNSRVAVMSRTNTKHLIERPSWGIVFPVHGEIVSKRSDIANASWYSICRAIRLMPSDDFNVLVIDDHGDPTGGADFQRRYVTISLQPIDCM